MTRGVVLLLMIGVRRGGPVRVQLMFRSGLSESLVELARLVERVQHGLEPRQQGRVDHAAHTHTRGRKGSAIW